MSVGCCGPFGGGDDFDVDASYDALCIEAEALRTENRFLRRELNATRVVITTLSDQLARLIEETK